MSCGEYTYEGRRDAPAHDDEAIRQLSLKLSEPNAANLMPGPTADIMRTTQNDRGYEDVMTFMNVPV